MVKRSLILDANNILYRTFFAHINVASSDPEDLIGLCHHSALWAIRSYYNEYPADEIVIAFDSKSWRKLYTSDLDECVTYLKYKGQRRQGLTKKQEEEFRNLDAHINELYEILRDQTSLLVLKEHLLEADDLIAGYIQSNPETKHVLITSDKDYMQLLCKHDLTIIDPASGKPRSLKDWDNDPDLFLFEKCIRGDKSDNIISAYPRLRRTKILDAYKDDYVKQNIMNNSYKTLINLEDGEVKEITLNTGDVFEENKYLIDLDAQPEYIKNLINKTIDHAIANKSKFNYVKFLKFCKANKLANVIKNADSFVPMLAARNIRG